MVVSNEIRLGNWLKWGDVPVIVTAIKTNKVAVISKTDEKQFVKSLSYNEVAPYPLSPDLIAACGFNKNQLFPHLDAFSHKKYHLNVNIVGNIYEISFGLIKENIGMIYQRKCWLHQFQNLFFSLTGNELEVVLITDL